jgi:site-specific DNA recombinase
MAVARYARVSPSQQHPEGTVASQRRALQQHMQHPGWSRLPEHAYSADGRSGARLARPALDRLRAAARRGAFDAVGILAPDRRARHEAQQWLLIEACAKMNTQLLLLPNPFGESPQGQRLPQMPGMSAEYGRAQMAERPRRGRVAQARQGAFMPGAYPGYGYR